MYEDKQVAYQKQGILRHLQQLGYEYTEAYDLIRNYSVNLLRYRYNIPDNELNYFWYKALGC